MLVPIWAVFCAVAVGAAPWESEEVGAATVEPEEAQYPVVTVQAQPVEKTCPTTPPCPTERPLVMTFQIIINNNGTLVGCGRKENATTLCEVQTQPSTTSCCRPLSGGTDRSWRKFTFDTFKRILNTTEEPEAEFTPEPVTPLRKSAYRKRNPPPKLGPHDAFYYYLGGHWPNAA